MSTGTGPGDAENSDEDNRAAPVIERQPSVLIAAAAAGFGDCSVPLGCMEPGVAFAGCWEEL